LRQDNQPVAQGFAGKVYLFDEDHQALPASGKFTVYAYDESNSTDTDKPAHIKPDFAWEIPESELESLIKKDPVGWSYSFWLPCGVPLPVERRYTIIARFTPEQGPSVIGESTLVTLPALQTDLDTTLAAKSPSVELASRGGEHETAPGKPTKE
jgi:hypothetical protein